MVTFTSPQLFAKLPQFVVEITEGDTPSSPTFTSCGSCTSIEIRKGNEIIDIQQVGVEDSLDLTDGRHTYTATLELQFAASTFIKRWINAANFNTPSGTVSETFTVLYSQYLNGTENYILLKGCRPKSITITAEIGQPLKARCEIECVNIAKPTTSPSIGTPTYASNPSGAQWTWLDGGAQPLSWNSISLNARSFTVTIDRGTMPIHLLGAAGPVATLPHQRVITGSFTVAYTASEATTLETDFDGNTARTLAYVLKSAVSTLTLSGCKITNYSRIGRGGENDIIVENVDFKALSAAIT